MKALLNLFNKYYFKSFFSPFFTFIFPIIVLGTFGLIGQDKAFVMPGIISMVTVSVGMNGIPSVIVDFKTSVLMKRIGTTPIKKWHFTVTIISFFFVITIFAVLWTMMWATFIFWKDRTMIFRFVNWGEFIYSQIFTIGLSSSLGFAIGVLSRNAAMAGAIGSIVGITSNFLSGQLIPMNEIAKIPALNGISYVFPFRYTTGLTITAFNAYNDVGSSGAAMFDVTKDFYQTALIAEISDGKPIAYFKNTLIYTKIDKILNFSLPIFYIGLFSGYTSWRFKWGKR